MSSVADSQAGDRVGFLPLCRGEYSLLSWSYFKPVHVELVLTSWARQHGIEVVRADQISGFWRRVAPCIAIWRCFLHAVSL